MHAFSYLTKSFSDFLSVTSYPILIIYWVRPGEINYFINHADYKDIILFLAEVRIRFFQFG